MPETETNGLGSQSIDYYVKIPKTICSYLSPELRYDQYPEGYQLDCSTNSESKVERSMASPALE